MTTMTKRKIVIALGGNAILSDETYLNKVMEDCFDECFVPMFSSDFHKIHTPPQLVLLQAGQLR